MHLPRLRLGFALLSVVTLSGCSFVHFGKLPDHPGQLASDNSRLQAENSQLQQELALSQKQGTTLRALLENGPDAPAASRQLVAELNETTRQLAALRNDYARLKAEQDRAAGSAPASATPAANNSDNNAAPDDLKTQLSDTENKLAAALRTYTQLEQENNQLHTEVDKVREQNSTLATQLKDVTTQNQAAQAALSQLNTELLAQKEARARSQQESDSLRSQLLTANDRIASLSAARTSSAGSAQTLSPGLTIAAETGATEPAARFETSAARARARAAGDANADTADLVSQLSQLRAKVATLESERTGLQQLLAAASANANGAPAGSGNGTPPTDAEANLATALRSYSVVQAENDQLKAENEKAAAEKAAIEAQLAVTKNAMPIAAQANSLREQLRQAQGQAAALAAENSQLKTRLALSGPVALPQSAAAPTRPSAASGIPPSGTPNPPSSAPAPAARTHTIATGDTLAKISRQYYGTPDRWSDILAANRDILRDEKSLIIGRVIRIP
jgi:nucleoid-associated protein YgaU